MKNFIAIDFETNPVPYFESKGRNKITGLGHPRLAQPTLITLSDGLSTRHHKNPPGVLLEKKEEVVFHNASFDVPVGTKARLWDTQFGLDGNVHCTWLMAKLLRNDRPTALKSLAREVLGETEVVLYEQASKSSEEDFIRYAENDALYTAKLYPILSVLLSNLNQWELYSKVELPFLFLNLECERNGFLVDVQKLAYEKSYLEQEVKALEAQLPKDINWNSPKQIKQKVYGEWNLPLAYSKGRVSTGKKALESLGNDERVSLLLALKKLKSSSRQLDSLKRFIILESGLIHPYINTLGADTGRCTSSSPNLQNIPKESRMRELFIARPKHKLGVLDFGQIEPRVLANFLYPSNFSNLFFENEDFYTRLGREVFSDFGEDTLLRTVAKQVVLATFYGMGAKTLSENLKVNQNTAQMYLDRFFSAYPEIIKFRDQQICFARENGYAVGLLNRRRYIANLNSSDERKRFSAERQVLNAVVQGSAATLFKYKLVKLREGLPKNVRFLLHVHDEVILEVPEDQAEEILKVSKQLLEEPLAWFKIPLVADGGVGSNWAQAKGV